MREYAPDQTVFMFTISAAERQGHRGGRAGVFPDGQEALPKPACRRDAALLACGCQGGVVLRDGCAAREVWCCAMVVLPGRCGAVGACLSGRGLSKGTAPDAGTVRGCPVPGGAACRSRPAIACWPCRRPWAGLGVRRLDMHLPGRCVRQCGACRCQRCGSVPSMQMARTTKVLGTLASMGIRWVANWFSEVRLSLARLTR